VLFVVDADLPRSVGDAIRRRGYEAIDVRDVGLGAAPDSEIAEFARARIACIITGDFGFADVRSYPPAAYPGLVVLQLPRNATAAGILRLADALLDQPDLLAKLPGRLAIVEPGRIRLRPG
jgi:predicted nuclease of predicted toxin-antitoxin system